ncbi:MAG: ester cyclase [Pseudomonadota bacterium]
MTPSHREICETFFRRVWSEQDEGAIDELLLPEAHASGLTESGLPMVGPDAFKAFHRAVLALIDNVEIIIDHAVVEGAWASLTLRIEATSRATGEKIGTRGHMLAKIVDGNIVEGHNHVDFIALFEQLGLLPKHVLTTCLSGNSVA